MAILKKNQPAGIPPRSSRQIRFSNRQSSQLSKINIKLYVSIGGSRIRFLCPNELRPRKKNFRPQFWSKFDLKWTFGEFKIGFFEVGKDTNRWIRSPVFDYKYLNLIFIVKSKRDHTIGLLYFCTFWKLHEFSVACQNWNK